MQSEIKQLLDLAARRIREAREVDFRSSRFSVGFLNVRKGGLREAEERAKQEEERRRREEERARRETEEKRRQEEEYYTRLEAERRRQHEEAERKLLTPDEPGLYRPPLPRDYQPPLSTTNTSTTTSNNTNPPPTPPQRNTSYLKTQVISPDTLYTAKFVSYNDEEEEEEEEEEDGGLAGQVKLSATRKSYGDLLPAQKPPPPPTARKPRPLSDGIFLSASFQLPAEANANSTAHKAGQVPPPPIKPKAPPLSSISGVTCRFTNVSDFVSIPSHASLREKRNISSSKNISMHLDGVCDITTSMQIEVCRWRRGVSYTLVERQTRGRLRLTLGASSSGGDQENSIGGAPENLTFKERQRLFSQGKEVSNKVKASRKLMELENELNTKQ
ncbi:Afadin [Bagarius yarrelli]|uniref:Afadin n=1 Tax=Bagarius yarrelli TaxID=175774 RepID=A0A556V2I9_BAGYA|nr:Afadin [Bagarius yarrelli]